MYKIKNGILHKDDTPVFGMGTSYYASYHAKKVPVPETGDRIGEIKKDIHGMKEAGYNIVRCASIGHVFLDDDGKINVETPIIDAMMREADEVDIATMVRLQGYDMCYHDFEDSAMINQHGVALDRNNWTNFIQNCLHHKGVLEDNELGTRALAKHYSQFKNVVSYVTYNEPHYPGGGYYDYNPHAIAAYKKWLVEKGIKTKEEAEKTEPPTRRPISGEDPLNWVNWRLFSLQSMVRFLNESAGYAKQECPEKMMTTCMTPQMLETTNTLNCVEYFDVGKEMDIVGITLYKNACGGDYFTTDLILSGAESAAAVHGKHMWLIEYDCATAITREKFNRQTYMAVGNGAKGIMYYQWRGDHPFEGAPEPNMFGVLNSDGTKAPNYEFSCEMTSLLNKLSPKIVASEKLRSGVAVLHSDYASLYCDATENGFANEKGALQKKELGGMFPAWLKEKLSNSYEVYLRIIYAMLRERNINIEVVKAEHLKDNKTGVKALFVPMFELLSPDEIQQVRDFAKSGGKVYILSDESWHFGLTKPGFDLLDTPRKPADACFSVEEALEFAGINAIMKFDCKSHALKANVLEGDGYYLVAVTNTSVLHDTIAGAKLKIAFEAKSAKFIDPKREIDLEIKGNKIFMPEISDGGFVLIEK